MNFSSKLDLLFRQNQEFFIEVYNKNHRNHYELQLPTKYYQL